MLRLKADFHAHSADDFRDRLSYSAEMLIDDAARAGIQVLTLVSHEQCISIDRLVRYAAERGILLLFGIELLIDNKHILIINPDEQQKHISSFHELEQMKGRNEAIIAPHPFFPSGNSLGHALYKHIHLFDAIEYCYLHLPGLNLNRRAVRLAKKHHIPLIGTSDTHILPYLGTTYTWIEAEPSPEGVTEAIRSGRVWFESRPTPLSFLLRTIWYVALSHSRTFFEKRQRKVMVI